MIAVDEIAEICHEANRRVCYSLGDYSQAGWHEITPTHRQQVALGVAFVAVDPDVSHLAFRDWREKSAPLLRHPELTCDTLFVMICKILIPF